MPPLRKLWHQVWEPYLLSVYQEMDSAILRFSEIAHWEPQGLCQESPSEGNSSQSALLGKLPNLKNVITFKPSWVILALL